MTDAPALEVTRVPIYEALRRRKPRVMLGLPTRDMVHMDFSLSLLGMGIVSSLMVELMPANPRSCYVQCNRNDIVQAALDHDAEWILWIDSDVEFPPDALIRLLGHEQPIVGATYIRRSEPYTSLMGERMDKTAMLPMEGIEEMLRIPTGMLLTKVDVFRAIEPPWFWLTWDKKLRKVDLGDDYYFCAEARKAGFKIYNDNKLTSELAHHCDIGLRPPRRTFTAAAE